MSAMPDLSTTAVHSRINLGWVAGFVDGEASIRIAKRLQHAGMRVRHNYSLEVSIAQKSFRTLQHFRAILGIDATLYPLRAITSDIQPVFSLTYRNSKAQALLELIEPYLVCKRVQASIGIEFQQRIKEDTSRWRRCFSDDEIALREGYYKQLQEAKQGA